MKIVIDRDIPYIRGVFEPFATVVYIKGAEISNESIRDSSVLIVRTRTKCNEELLANSCVKLIATATIGTDHIDLNWCRANGITVKSAAGCNSRGVLQWVTAVMVFMSKKYNWQPSSKSIGVVGVGHVGSLVAKYAKTWGFKVLCCDPPRVEAESVEAVGEFVDFETILKKCDIITFHTPLKKKGEYPTIHMLNESNIDMLGRDTLILNSSRGEVVATKTLLRHIQRGGKCCIDTWDSEPHISSELLAAIDVATPHIAGYSKQGKATATAMVVKYVSEHCSLPIENWFPRDVKQNRVTTPPSWDYICNYITNYYNIESDTSTLKINSVKFEELRDNYIYRDEFF